MEQNSPAVGAPLDAPVGPLPADAVHLEITSCKRCPFMRADRHYTGDSFELCFDWKCTKNHDAIIANMDWNDKEPPIPKWCPLRPNVELTGRPLGRLRLSEGLAGPHENRHNLGARHACNE